RLPALLVHAGRHVGMGDHASAGASQRNRDEVMIRMMMREHQPADRPVRHRADGANELLPLGGAREGVDHDNALGRHGEARVGPALRPPPGITHDGKDVRGERPNRKTDDTTARGDMMDATRSRDQRQRNASKGCYSTNLISTLRVKTPPLLSFQVNANSVPPSPRSGHYTNAPRLLHEAHTNFGACQ